MKKLLLIFLSGFLSLLFANIGKIAVSKGEVNIIRNNASIKASNDFILEKSDQIKTGADGKVQLIFTDNTVITIGAKSTLNVNEYVFDEQNKKAEANFNVVEGTFRTITGKIGKANPEKFKLLTKSASIGIRGTIFGGDENSVFCEDGEIGVESNGVKVFVKKDQIITTSRTQKPTTPRTATKQEKEKVKESSGSNDPDMQKNEQKVLEEKNNPEAVKKEETAKQEENDDDSFNATPTPIEQQEAPDVVNVLKQVDPKSITDKDKQKELDNTVSKTDDNAFKGRELSLTTPGDTVNNTTSSIKLTSQGNNEHGQLRTLLEYKSENSDYTTLTTLYFDDASTPYSYSSILEVEDTVNQTIVTDMETFTDSIQTTIIYDNKGEFIVLSQYHSDLREVGQSTYSYEIAKLAYAGKAPTMSALQTGKIYQYSILNEFELTASNSGYTSGEIRTGELGSIYLNSTNKSIFMDTDDYLDATEFGANFSVFKLNTDGTISGKYYNQAFRNDMNLYQDSHIDTITGSLYGSELQGLGLEAIGKKYENYQAYTDTSLVSASYLNNTTTATNPTGSVTMDGYLTGFAFNGTYDDIYDSYSGSGYTGVSSDFSFAIDKSTAAITGSGTSTDSTWNWGVNASNANLSSYYIDSDKFGALFSTFSTTSSQSISSNSSWFFTIPDSYDSVNNTLSYDTEDYSSWGYWTATAFDDQTTKDHLFYVDQYSTWVAGEVTPTATIQDLINNSTSYTYSGNVLGSINDGNRTAAIAMDSMNNISLTIDFGAGTFSGTMNFQEINSGGEWHATINSEGTSVISTSGFNTTNITGTGGSGDLTSGSIDGQFYGPNAQSVGGKFNLVNEDNLQASGVFKAKR
ncbi:MAG: FecR domain-containing protein [Arcobacteraceae bacterium]